MILMAAGGMDNDEIAARLDTRREVVSQWRQRFFKERLAGLQERAPPGRPRGFPPDPQFQFKAGRILDMYERRWQGQALRDDEFVISADEKTSIQARLRTH